MTGRMHTFEGLTTSQAAKILGVSIDTVNRWARDGKIQPAFKAPGITGPRFYDRSEIEALADASVPNEVSL